MPRGLIEDAEKTIAPPSTTRQDLDGDPACNRRPPHPQPQKTELPRPVQPRKGEKGSPSGEPDVRRADVCLAGIST